MQISNHYNFHFLEFVVYPVNKHENICMAGLKPDFHSEQFSERADLCVFFLLKCVLSSITNVITYAIWLTGYISKDIDRKIPRARQIALNGNQP